LSYFGTLIATYLDNNMINLTPVSQLSIKSLLKYSRKLVIPRLDRGIQ